MVGDQVWIRDPVTKLWKSKGEVTEARQTNTESLPSYFVVMFDNGHIGIRHKSYLRHEIVREEEDGQHSDDGTIGGGRRISFAEEAPAGPVTRSKARETY